MNLEEEYPTSDPNWRGWVITEGPFQGRRLGDLSRDEFERMAPAAWLTLIAENWHHPDLTDVHRRNYRAIRGRFEYEKIQQEPVELKPAPEPLGQPMKLVSPLRTAKPSNPPSAPIRKSPPAAEQPLALPEESQRPEVFAREEIGEEHPEERVEEKESALFAEGARAPQEEDKYRDASSVEPQSLELAASEPDRRLIVFQQMCEAIHEIRNASTLEKLIELKVEAERLRLQALIDQDKEAQRCYSATRARSDATSG
jgi:hypothetical protein